MLQRPIPSSGEKIGVVGVGTWQTFDVGSEAAEREKRREVLDVLFQAGGQMVDSSPMYGRAEAVVGEILAGMKARDRAFIATKVWTQGEAAGLAQMKASSEKLRAPVIDLMQIHNLVDWRTHLKSLRAGKEAGRYRYIGITHYTVSGLDDLANVLEREKLDFVQMAYSVGIRAAEKRLLPTAQARGVAVIVNKPFDGGAAFSRIRSAKLPGVAAEFGATGWPQLMLKFVLGHAAVTCAIPGTANPVHARDNVAAGRGPLPDERQRKAIAAAWDSI